MMTQFIKKHQQLMELDLLKYKPLSKRNGGHKLILN